MIRPGEIQRIARVAGVRDQQIEKHGMDVDFLINEFSNKCISKGLSAADFHSKLEARMPQYRSRWKTTLGEQIHDLPDFEQVEREVTRHLKKLPRR
jgi:uncharacterized protein